MANICTTEIKLIMEEENAVKMKSLLMDESLQVFDKEVPVSNIYKQYDIKPNAYTHLRANWQGFEIEQYGDDVVLSIIEESAWNPTQLALQLQKEGIVKRFVFYAEECGNGIFCTNDEIGEFFDFRWYVYLSDKGEQEYFKDFQDAIEYVYNTTGKRFETVEDANEDDEVFIHPIEIVDDNEL